MNEITKYTDYCILSPDWFIDRISEELAKRDLPGLTGGVVRAINVTGEHPIVQLMMSVLVGGTPNFSGLVPAISVIDSDETEEATTVGQGLRAYELIDAEWIATMKATYHSMKERYKEGLITDTQIRAIETALAHQPTGKLLVEVHQFFQRESVYVSLWTHTAQERQIIGTLLRSILYDLRTKMIGAGLTDISINTAKGLVNPNFGKVLLGQETNLRFLNKLFNYTVYDCAELPVELDVHGAFTAPTQSALREGFQAVGTDDRVIMYPEEES